MSAQPLSPSRQVIFHQMLVATRKTALIDALSETLASSIPICSRGKSLSMSPRTPKNASQPLASGMSMFFRFPLF